MKKSEVLGKSLSKDQQRLIIGANGTELEPIDDAKRGKCCVGNECSECVQDPDCSDQATFVKC